MARNSVSDRQLREYWERAQSLQQAHADYCAERDAPVGAASPLIDLLGALQNALEVEANSNFHFSEFGKTFQKKHEEIRDRRIQIEKQFRRLLAQEINSGRKIAIGLKKSKNREDIRFVWDGSVEPNGLDPVIGEYRGPASLFCDVRIIDRAHCDEKLREKFDRLREGKKGRPQLASIPIAIDRVFLRHPDLDKSNFIKRASEKILLEIAEMRKSGETNEEPEESTIQGALRKRWKNTK